jgi:hypothetical protein
MFDASASALNEHLWDGTASAYTNAFFNGSYYPRRSPTMFYPLMSGVASDAQVEATVLTFLTSPEHFCVTTSHRGPPNTTLGVHYFVPATNGSLFCGTDACNQDQVSKGATWLRVEALPWAADAGADAPSGALPLQQYYEAASGLYAISTGGPPSSGYAFLRTEGLCAPAPAPGLVPLDEWVLPGASSRVLCGTSYCAAAAAAAGYVQGATLCYAGNATGWANLPCKFGVVPSIARSDVAFNAEGDAYNYWRGRIWGPQVALIYFGLQRYDSIPAVRAARLVLVSEARALMLRDWRLYRHINENYNSVTGSGSDNGSADPAYHWGALLGFLSLLEAGL